MYTELELTSMSSCESSVRGSKILRVSARVRAQVIELPKLESHTFRRRSKM